MMRFFLLLTALLTTSLAFAFDVQKLNNTIDVFRSGTTAEGYVAHNADRVLANLRGYWFGIILFSAAEVENAYDRLCQKNYSAIDEVGPNGFTLTSGKETERPLHVRFELIMGNVYSVVTPQDEYVRRLGLEGQTDFQKRAGALARNGIATIHRVDEDTLVIQKNYQMPEIYVRCPD